MENLIGTTHLAQYALHGPAERIVVQLWLSEITGLRLNAFPDGPLAAVTEIPDAYARGANVQILTRTRRAAARTALRAA
jgi:hypothetical protein